MKKIDPTVLRETVFVATVSVVLSTLMQSVFLVLGFWDYTVILGNVLGFAAGVGNFFLMGLTVQSALEKEEKEARAQVKLSQSLRLLMLFVIALVGYLLSVFNTIAMIIPFLFPRIAVSLRPFIKK